MSGWPENPNRVQADTLAELAALETKRREITQRIALLRSRVRNWGQSATMPPGLRARLRCAPDRSLKSQGEV